MDFLKIVLLNKRRPRLSAALKNSTFEKAPRRLIEDLRYIIYIITSFINSETIALLHLTSFTEDVSLSQI